MAEFKSKTKPAGLDHAGNPAPVPNEHSARLLRRATVASITLASFLVVIKLGAWIVTDSVALLSSTVDSVLDVVASLINFIAVRHALVPADAEHRFGHGKAEAVAGLGQSAVIAGSAAFLLFQSGARLIHPAAIDNSTLGIAIMVVSMVLTLVLVLYQRHVARITKSIVITADSLHFESDFLMNMGVIVALVLTSRYGLIHADPLIAMGIALYVARSAWKIWLISMDVVMDRELPDRDRARIREIARAHPQVIGLHDLRTRSSGSRIFIQFHIEVPADSSLKHAHAISDEIEAALAEAFPGAEILIHFDPDGINEPRADFGRE